jgi:hypothetical protein
LPTTTVIRAGFAAGESALAQAAATQNNNAVSRDLQPDTRDLRESCQSIGRGSPKEMLCVDDGLMTIAPRQRDRNMSRRWMVLAFNTLSTLLRISFITLSTRTAAEA